MSEQLKIDFLLPAIERRRIGAIVLLPMSLLMPDVAYQCREPFLQICEKASPQELRATAYWKSREAIGHSTEYIQRRVESYIKLLKKIRRKGIVTNPSDPRSFPIVLVHGDIYQRLDGAHRVSIYRSLGHNTVEVWLVTTGEILAKLVLPPDLKTALESEVNPWVYAHEYTENGK